MSTSVVPLVTPGFYAKLRPNMADTEEVEAVKVKQGPPGPKRYQVITRGDDAFAVVCANASNLFLQVERGLSVSESARRKIPHQTIYLDGVYTGPPFYDNKARHYSLDHHSGCVRAFTLATCEQAVVMLLQGLPLNEGEWTVFVNEPDLDSLLAAWVLLNHADLLRQERELLHLAMPLIRVEGVIDAHGHGFSVLTGLGQDEYQRLKGELDQLMEQERQLKKAGAWSTMDLFQYSRDMLEAIDELIFPPAYLEQLGEVEEVARTEVVGQKLAILCRSKLGIYEVEEQLKARYDKRVAIIILDAGGGCFTLRQLDPFFEQGLAPLYKALNQKDPVARAAGSSEEKETRWGGSDDIGGSPRPGGSELTPEQVLDLVRTVYGRKDGWIQRVLKKIKM